MLHHLQRSLQLVLHPGYADAGAIVAAPTVSAKLAAKCSSTSQLTHSWVFHHFLSPSLKANRPPPWLLLRRPLPLRPATSSLPGTPRRPHHLLHHRSCRIRRPPSPAPSSAELKQQRRSGDLAAASCTPATVSFPQSPSPPPASSSAARARRITRAHDDADSTGHSDVDLQVRRGFTR
jgi:hypothetical protein